MALPATDQTRDLLINCPARAILTFIERTSSDPLVRGNDTKQ